MKIVLAFFLWKMRDEMIMKDDVCHVSLDDIARRRRSSCAFKMVLYLKI